MHHTTLLLWLALLISTALADTTVWATPHDSYSSSIGVLGCKVNTNRIAYWPMSVDCTNICVRLSYSGRSVYLLRVDQSGGAYDVSYDAWNYLLTGSSATSKPTAGGATQMTYEDVDASNCASLISTSGHKLPLSAANSMDFLASCLAEQGSWVAKNYVLYNILDSVCSYGYDETCSLNLEVSNQAKCPHMLGMPTPLSGNPVYNIKYPTGQKVLATTGQSVTSEGSMWNAPMSLGIITIMLSTYMLML
jgi:cerato-platanin